jgi:hypothetical protein
MANAAVLRDSRIIQTTNLTGKRFDLFGFLVEFTIKQSNITYIFVDQRDLDPADLDDLNPTKLSSPQYYAKTEFLKYLDKTKYLKDLYTADRLKNSDIILAADDDDVVVQRLHTSAPEYAAFGSVEIYSVKKSDITVKDNEEIQFINDSIPTIKTIPNISPVSLLFYQARTDIIMSFSDPDERKEVAYTVANIALMINMINRDIFNGVFKDSGTEIANYITAQNNEWSLNAVSDNPTLPQLRLYYRGLSSFYRDVYKNQLEISRAGNQERLYWLMSILSQGALTVLPLQTKIDLLLFLEKNKLKDSEENEKDESLVIRVLLSFNENNVDDIDELVEALIEKKPDANSSETLYQLLYEKMSTSTNFTEGLFVLYNWVFGTQYKPNQTKGQYVQAVYALWQFSKYNPYDTNGNIKADTLGFKVLDPALASFTAADPDDNKDMLFYYSHVVGYESYEYVAPVEYTGPQLYLYRQKYAGAAPIVMPYESTKFIGIFFDNFNFKFSGENLSAYQELPVRYSYNQHNYVPDYRNPVPELDDVLYGTYHIFQPVSVLNTNRETKAPFVTTDGNPVNIDGSNINSFIPVFVLEYIANAADRSNVETMIGYVVDGALTFTGIGNLSKLRYLRWAAAGAEEIGLWSIEGLRVVVGGVDFTSGVLNYLLNFANCSEDNKFCKGLKSFFDALQIAALSINSIDSLATLTARMKARKLLAIASDATEDEAILADLKNALGNGEGAEEVAGTILRFADRASQFDEFLNHAKQIRGIVLKKIEQSIKLLGEDKKLFIANTYLTDDIQTVVEHLSTKVNFAGQLLDKVCADFVFIASKDGKIITREELIKQITFYYDEVLKRGFPSGFSGLANFETFCNKTRTFFSSRLKRLWNPDLIDVIDWEKLQIDVDYVFDHWENFNFEERVEMIVQGSANRKYLDGPLLYLKPEGLPASVPGDFEFAMRMSKADFKIFVAFLDETYKGYFSNELRQCLKKGFIKTDLLEKLDKSIANDFRNLVKNDTSFPGKKDLFGNVVKGKDINFAIVQANGPYDLEPYLNFTY